MSVIASSLTSVAQTPIQLIAPSKTGGLDIMESFWNRHSDREYADRALTDQDLSDLLFAASGINRPEEGKITAPSALNTQEIDLYLFDAKGVYKYIPEGHKLLPVAEGDFRQLIAGTPQFSQDFVIEAPISLLIVANPQKFECMNDMAVSMATVDAGIMTENICIFCAARGLACVPRATMDHNEIANLLSLPDQAIPVLNVPVGFPK